MSASHELSDDPIGKLMEGLLECFDEVQPRPGVTRRVLQPVPDEADVVREIFRLYVALGGAKAVARELNQRGLKYRTGGAWTKDLVLVWGPKRAVHVVPTPPCAKLKMY